MKRSLYIKTYGCQMNVYDSNCMEELLAPLGYKKVKSPEDADMVILNTCHIREKATEKVFSELGRMNLIKQMRENDGKEMTLRAFWPSAYRMPAKRGAGEAMRW